MGKKTVGKITAKAILLLMILIFAALSAAGIYLGGQMRVIEKMASALERGDDKLFEECFAAPQKLEDCRIKTLSFYDVPEGDDFFIKYEFLSRSFSSLTLCEIKVKETVYTKDYGESRTDNFIVEFEKGKWRLTGF